MNLNWEAVERGERKCGLCSLNLPLATLCCSFLTCKMWVMMMFTSWGYFEW